MRGLSLVQRHLLRRGLFCWLLVRAAFAMALLMTMSPPWAHGGLLGLGVVSLSALLGFLEVQRVHERVLLANLAVTLPSLMLTLAAPAVIGEMMLVALLP